LADATWEAAALLALALELAFAVAVAAVAAAKVAMATLLVLRCLMPRTLHGIRRIARPATGRAWGRHAHQFSRFAAIA
jgi:hypothetical protein